MRFFGDMASHDTSSTKGDPRPSDPSTPKAVYVSVSVEPCNSEDTRKYWAEREARAKAGLANPSVHVNRASGEFDLGLVNAILAGKGELIATTVDGVHQDSNMSSSLSGAHVGDDTVVHHDIGDNDTSDSGPVTDAYKSTGPFISTQSISRDSVLRTSDPFVDKNTAKCASETTRYNVPANKRIGPYQSAASLSPTANPSDEDDIFIGGEPGPDVGYRYRSESRVRRPSTSMVTVPNNSHNVQPGPSSSQLPSYSICNIPPSSSRPASRARNRRPSDVHPKRSASSLRSKFSSRNISTSIDDQDRPIVVTNALHHIIYDAPCRHCETNNCACLTPDSPGVPPADPTSNSKTRIATEGFCRHCVLNRCSCIVEDPQWGLHHASTAFRQAQQGPRNTGQEQGQEVASEQQSLRIISDAGTVRRYATEQEHDDSGASSEGQMETTITTAPTTVPRTPPPAYRLPCRLRNNGNDHNIGNRMDNHDDRPRGDVEAQQEQQEQQPEHPSHLQRTIRMWHC
ncbi:hypothetical protein PG989_009072 [Apiospora arundinis]